MAIHLPQLDEAGPIKIAGAIDIYDSNILRDTLQHLFESRTEILLDLSDVESCDVSAVQLLYAAYKSAQKLDRSFSIIGISQPVLGTLTLLGLSAEQMGAV